MNNKQPQPEQHRQQPRPTQPRRRHQRRPNAADRVIAGLTALRDALESGKPLEEQFRVSVLWKVNSGSEQEDKKFVRLVY